MIRDRFSLAPWRGASLLSLLLLLILYLSMTDAGRAQAQDPTATPPPGSTAVVTGTLPLTGTVPLTTTVTPTQSGLISTTPVSEPTPTPVSAPAQSTATPTVPSPPLVNLNAAEILTGTILANRTSFSVTFFLEGRLYLLPPRRSTGIQLARPITALTLYSCAAALTTDESCFWDPYPIEQNGFYEILPDVADRSALTLVNAAPPPEDRFWIQNRTGLTETFFYQNRAIQLGNALATDLPISDSLTLVARVNLRRCLTQEGRSVCEWLPHPVRGGVYYAARLHEMPSGGGGSLREVSLEPILTREPPPTPTPTITPTPEPTAIPSPTATATPEAAISCQIQVPTLNVRTGPGTEYLAIDRLQTSDASGGSVLVVGRNAGGDWLAIAEDRVAGGWITALPGFLICDGNTSNLPLAEVTDGRLAPTPPTPTATSAVEEAPAEESEGESEGETESEAGVPEDRALLIVTNVYEGEIRFTLDATQHGLPSGSSSEYDLQPDETITFLIFPGQVRFSASSPVRAGSGNAEFPVEAGASRQIFIYFVPPDEGAATNWELRYE